jgi:hypothetical protein
MQALGKNMRFFVQFVEFGSGRSYIVLRGRWCDICMNTHAWNDNSDDSSDGCNEDLQQDPHAYSVGVLNAGMGREVVLKQRLGDECVQAVQRTVGPCSHSSV